MLRDHFKNVPKNATYRSKTIQNEIIDCCGRHTRQIIINEVKEAIYFSLLADEAQDVSNKEQMPLVLRFVDKNGNIREEFNKFILCDEDVSGAAISKSITTEIRSLGLDMQNYRGQGYDGAGNMAGKYQGTAARIQREHPLALHVHCASHRLNLCIVKSCEVLLVKTMMDKVKLVADFFNNSPKRQQALETNIRDLLGSGTRQKKMIDVCRTRWVERISALSKFTEMYEPIMVSLQEIKSNVEDHWNYDSCHDADGLFDSCSDFKFIMSLVVTKRIRSYAKATMKKLQSSTNYNVKGYEEIDLLKATVLDARKNIDGYHQTWYNEATALGDLVGSSPSMPRICKTQTTRDNQSADSPLTYYRITLTSQLLDHLINQLSVRFDKSGLNLVKGFVVIPALLRERIVRQG